MKRYDTINTALWLLACAVFAIWSAALVINSLINSFSR